MGTTSGEMAPEFDRAERRFRVLSGTVIFLVAVALVVYLQQPSVEQAPAGLQAGLVFASCDDPILGLSQPSIALWEVDPGNGGVTEQVAVDLPPDSQLAYPCETVAGLTRRLFDESYRHAVVQVEVPQTGARHVQLVALTDGAPQPLTRSTEPPFAPHARNELPVFGPDRRTIWYRASNQGIVQMIDPDSGTDRSVTTLHPAADAFVALDVLSGEILAKGDPTTPEYARDLALPNPRGDLAMGDGRLHMADDLVVPVTCANGGDPQRLMDCVPDSLRGGNGLRPAAWLDDRTLLTFYGTGGGANTLLRMEIDDLGVLRVCPAVPPSDWRHQAVVVSPDGDSFVTDAVRGGTRRLFEQLTAAGADQMPAPLAAVAVPGDARLIDWHPQPAVRPLVRHICR